MGLLGEIYSFGNRTRNKLRGLLDDPSGTIQQTVDAAAEGVLNLTGQNETAQRFALRDRINAGDKNALAEYKRLGQVSQNKLFDLATNFNPAAVGMTAWHGSPHKFDKFNLSKIGTGEGAQAYGHGLYLAESPAVAKEYQEKLSKQVSYEGRRVSESFPTDSKVAAAQHAVSQRVANGEDALSAINAEAKSWMDEADFYRKHIKDVPEAMDDVRNFESIASEIKKLKPESFYKNPGSLYKTDIPDEAVARFLDWDKPLSQQGAKAQDVLRQYHELNGGQGYMSDAGYVAIGKGASDAMTGADLYRYLGEIGSGKEDAAKLLGMHGFPGIRYLDGGSRSAGQGSSNFVIFDPEMIRILERNGEATGAQPWKPGELGGLLK